MIVIFAQLVILFLDKSRRTHCQIRPIFTFKFSIFVCFQKSKEDLLNDLVLCFNNFFIEIKAHKSRNIIFFYQKNVIFAKTTAQILHKNQIPI